MPTLIPNPDLAPADGGFPRWNSPGHRRAGFQNLPGVWRYMASFRAGRVLRLRTEADLAVAAREDVARLTALPWFSAMCVVRGDRVLFERYAADFGPARVHSVMSITKTSMHLMVGRLAAEGRVDLAARVDAYLPWIGPGYAAARVQDVLDMNVLNDYSEDYANPASTVYAHEESLGMRLPKGQEGTNRAVIAAIGLAPGATDCVNRTGLSMYRSANTEVLGFIAEAVTGAPLARFFADLADAAGIEGVLHIATDRTGFPVVNGGMAISARDLCRYGLLLARGGIGVDGRAVGSPDFLRATLTGGVGMPAPRSHLRYSNQTNTDGRWIGHAGYGGQYLLADPVTETAAVFFSVLDNASGYDSAYFPPVIRMLSEIATAA
ncbi:MAG: serine hydrolase domain-containing protein [Paracoccaceae bacterium]